MSRGHVVFVGLAIALGFFAILKLFAARPLSAEEKQAIEDRISAVWPAIQERYDLRQLRPAVIWDEPELYGGSRGAVAATVCGPQFPSRLDYALVVFDPDDAVADPDYFAGTTVPHELAHVVVCEIAPGENEHTATWKSVAVALGMKGE